MYEFREVKNPNIWETFVKDQPNTPFVQSVQYGKFYLGLGEKSWIFGVYEGGTLVGGSLVVSTHAKRGRFLFLPYGPIFLSLGERDIILHTFFSGLRQFARSAGYYFIRISPFVGDTDIEQQRYQRLGFRPSPMHMLAETTWLLDVTPSSDTLLGAMNKNHRNLIRRCERKGVRVEASEDPNSLASFHTLLDSTMKRHHFHRFSRKYIMEEFKAFAATNEILLLSAYLPDGRLDAAAIIVYYGNMACYRHGASLNLDKRLPTSYALQWYAIEEAKRRGCVWYNFWGIAPSTASRSHPFFGITHFKKGFGGSEKDLLHCQDLILSPWYWLAWGVEELRRINRGFG